MYAVDRTSVGTRLEPNLARRLQDLAKRNLRSVSAELARAVVEHVQREAEPHDSPNTHS